MLLHYLEKQETPEIAYSHLKAACCFTKNTRNTLKISPSPDHSWTPITVKTIDCICTRHDSYRENSILQYVTLTLDVYQVCHWVGGCVKNGSYSSSSTAWKSVKRLLGHLTISTNVKCYETLRWQFCLSARHCTGARLGTTAAWAWVASNKTEQTKPATGEVWQCNSTAFDERMLFLCFCISPGSSEMGK